MGGSLIFIDDLMAARGLEGEGFHPHLSTHGHSVLVLPPVRSFLPSFISFNFFFLNKLPALADQI